MAKVNTTSNHRSQVIDFAGMIHAPENEQGVVLLFGKLHRRLGFPTIDMIHAGFPDCWAYQRTGSGSKRIWIEFEYHSNSFKSHLTKLKGLKPRRGYVVCWEHNWPGCEKHAEVIDLRREVGAGRSVWIQSTRPRFQAWLDKTPKKVKRREEWTVAYKAKPGDILLMWRAGSHGEAKKHEVDPDLLHSFTNVFEVTSFPWHDKARGRKANVRQVALLQHPLYLNAIRTDAVLRNAPWLRASMQGRPDVTPYWWRLHNLITDLNPNLRKDKNFRQLDPNRF